VTIRGCTGKIPYATRAEADEAKDCFSRRKGTNGLNTYHCPACGAYHLGRDPAKSGRADRAVFDKGAKLRRYWQLIRGGA
jgi:hypothetical protein